MILAVSVRKLNEGVSFDQFRKAWEPPGGYPEALRHVYHGRAPEDPYTIVSIGVLDLAPDEFDRVRDESGEEERQRRMGALVESAPVDAVFELIEEIEP
jgi:hypothetical protein